MIRHPSFLLAPSLSLLMACGGGDTLDTTPDSETLIGVEPQDFAGEWGCRTPGGLETYVARLVDVTDGLVSNEAAVGEYPVQSSPPTRCDRTITFGLVTEGRSYVVDVDGYLDADQDPEHEDVCSIDGTSALLRRTDKDCDGAFIPPDIRWRCYGWQPSGTGEESSDVETDRLPEGRPGVSLKYRTVLLHYCVNQPEE